MSNLLLFLFAAPFISALIAFVFPVLSGRLLKNLTVILSLIPLAILLYGTNHWIDVDLQYDWIPDLSIEFYLSIDHLSLLFIYLVAIIIPITILATNTETLAFPRTFYGLVLLLQGLLIGFFSARDLALFTFFWEAMLIPLYFIINIWGGNQRQTAALKFLIYMIAGSALMVAGVIFLYFATVTPPQIYGSFNMNSLAGIETTLPNARWIFAIFLLAFAVKTPLFPFHAWLPDAYCQAPTSGTILLSSLLSKAGIYGILRIGMELFPTLLKEWSPILLGFAIAGVFYGGLAAWREKDYKRLIAYSSFSHVNFILAGLFIWSSPSHEGSILQALNHGVTIAALFLVAGWLEDRLGTTEMKYSGLAQFLPHLCWLTVFFVMASVALPGTNNFVGELLILFGLFKHNPWVAALLTLSVILSAMYMLRLLQKVYFEEPGFFQDSWIDIRVKELAIALPLIALILWVGIYPTPVLEVIQPATKKFTAIANIEDDK